MMSVYCVKSVEIIAPHCSPCEEKVQHLLSKLEIAMEALKDYKEHGLRADLNPTHDLNKSEEFWHGYIRRIEASIKERAQEAIARIEEK